MGGPHLDQPGLRAVPSLRYLQAVPAFTEHFYDSEDEGDESIDNGPTGGLTWDGRVDRGRDQARIPLLSPPGFQLLPYDCHEGNYMLAAVLGGERAEDKAIEEDAKKGIIRARKPVQANINAPAGEGPPPAAGTAAGEGGPR